MNLKMPGLTDFEAAEAAETFSQHDRKAIRALTKVWRAGVKPDKNSEYVRLPKDLEQELEAAILTQLNAGKSPTQPVETPASAKVAMPE